MLLSAHEPAQKCQRCLELFPASQATELITSLVHRVVRRFINRLIKKFISTWTSLRTSLWTRQRMSLSAAIRWIHGRELSTPPPANEGDNAGEAGPDPSLPTTGSRGRVQPRSLVQGAGGGVASWEKGSEGKSVGQ